MHRLFTAKELVDSFNTCKIVFGLLLHLNTLPLYDFFFKPYCSIVRVAANSHAGSVNPGDAVVTKIKAKNKVGLPFLLSSLYQKTKSSRSA